jgi:hypothetical protein
MEAEMTGGEMVMKMLSGLVIGMMVGLPILMWCVLLVVLARRGARNVHERFLDLAADRRQRRVSRHVWVSIDDVLPGQRVPSAVSDHSVLPGAPLDDQPAAVIAAVAHRVFDSSR